jgi:hypothetical protein
MINRLAREEKIGILCVQETHLTNKHERQIKTLFSRRLLVLNSSDNNCPGNLVRVAFVINKEKIKCLKCKNNSVNSWESHHINTEMAWRKNKKHTKHIHTKQLHRALTLLEYLGSKLILRNF